PHLGTPRRCPPTTPTQQPVAPVRVLVVAEEIARASKLGGHQLVPEAGYGDDPFWMRWVALNLPSECRHMGVAGALVSDVGALPEMLHDLAACENSPRLVGE